MKRTTCGVLPNRTENYTPGQRAAVACQLPSHPGNWHRSSGTGWAWTWHRKTPRQKKSSTRP